MTVARHGLCPASWKPVQGDGLDKWLGAALPQQGDCLASSVDFLLLKGSHASGKDSSLLISAFKLFSPGLNLHLYRENQHPRGAIIDCWIIAEEWGIYERNN